MSNLYKETETHKILVSKVSGILPVLLQLKRFEHISEVTVTKVVEEIASYRGSNTQKKIEDYLNLHYPRIGSPTLEDYNSEASDIPAEKTLVKMAETSIYIEKVTEFDHYNSDTKTFDDFIWKIDTAFELDRVDDGDDHRKIRILYMKLKDSTKRIAARPGNQSYQEYVEPFREIFSTLVNSMTAVERYSLYQIDMDNQIESLKQLEKLHELATSHLDIPQQIGSLKLKLSDTYAANFNLWVKIRDFSGNTPNELILEVIVFIKSRQERLNILKAAKKKAKSNTDPKSRKPAIKC